MGNENTRNHVREQVPKTCCICFHNCNHIHECVNAYGYALTSIIFICIEECDRLFSQFGLHLFGFVVLAIKMAEWLGNKSAARETYKIKITRVLRKAHAHAHNTDTYIYIHNS